MLAKLFGILLLLFFITVVIFNYRKYKDLFCPLCIFSLFQFLKYVPSFLANKQYEHFTPITDSMAFKLFWIELLFCISVCLGWCVKVKISSGNKLERYTQISNTTRVSLPFIYFIYLVGLIIRIYIISTSGGISYILNNTSVAYLSLSNGIGYISILSNFMIIGILMLLEYISKEEKKVRRKRLLFTLVIWFIVAAASYLIFSSRTQTMVMLLTIAFGYNYFFKKIRLVDIFRPKILLVLLIGSAVVIVFPMIRSGNFDNNGIGTLISKFFDEFSFYGRDAFVYDHFSYDNYWFGRSYLNIIKAPIPSSILPSKPAIDDGIYLTHLLNGINISPTAGRNLFQYKYSIPFSSQSSLYANFGVVGVIFGGILTGQLYRYSYDYVTNVNSGTIIMMYYVFVYLFGFTTYNIVHSIILIILISVTWKCSLFFRRKATRELDL